MVSMALAIPILHKTEVEPVLGEVNTLRSPDDGSDESSSEGRTEGHSYHGETEAGHCSHVLPLDVLGEAGGGREDVGGVVRLLGVEVRHVVSGVLVVSSALELLQVGEES